jgi:hypothetical protein
MRRAWHELRGPVSALVLLAILARLLLPLPALAAVQLAHLDTIVRTTLCLPSSEAAPSDEEDSPTFAAGGAHCPLCRLPDADPILPPDLPIVSVPTWAVTVRHDPVSEPPAARPFPRGPPPARAPPFAPIPG